MLPEKRKENLGISEPGNRVTNLTAQFRHQKAAVALCVCVCVVSYPVPVCPMTPVTLEFEGELVQSDFYLHYKPLSEVSLKLAVSRFFTNSRKQKHRQKQFGIENLGNLH